MKLVVAEMPEIERYKKLIFLKFLIFELENVNERE